MKNRVFDLLGAFFGPCYRDWWLAYANDPEHISPFHNHWLVRRSAAVEFSNGWYRVSHSRIGPQKPIQVDGTLPLLGDHSRTGIQTIDARFIGTHARLSDAIQFLNIARSIAPEALHVSPSPVLAPNGPPPQHRSNHRVASSTVSSPLSVIGMGHVFLMLWLLVPCWARIAAYDFLRKLGLALYGPPGDFSTVQRLPFGLYLKYNGTPHGYRNEFQALKLVRKYTTVPVPEPLDVAIRPVQHVAAEESPASLGHAYLLITRIPGVPLSHCQYHLSEKDRKQIVGQMRSFIAQIRGIPNLVNRDAPICNTRGETCQNSRIRGDQPVGPFADEVSFSRLLRYPDEPSRRGHKIVFTHADLNPRNILVDQVTQEDGSKGWIVTGIIDWEFSGYYPEYWDYTKAMFEGFRWIKRYNDMVTEIFQEFGDYTKELDVETRSWVSGDGV
ncbi:hypothetical protein NPX13_g4904 [Xylaria arbuscula]|uniref:Aminoglycoside phosphotransferase domain-containing protein n=1 Tax=Xylaria arbuscula TaxID=114810 RepID=A0A9W8TN68_9PEZI|nr:hypothetical protein NPX13_g4904 [Xylaria arbuscula]